jgi:hypothetical protein
MALANGVRQSSLFVAGMAEWHARKGRTAHRPDNLANSYLPKLDIDSKFDSLIGSARAYRSLLLRWARSALEDRLS